MRRTTLTLVAAAAALLAAAPSVTLAASDPANCTTHADASAIETAAGIYLRPTVRLPVTLTTVSVWYESNGAPGLQTGRSYCGPGEPYLPADTEGPSIGGALRV